MSTVLNNSIQKTATELLDGGVRIAIATAEWNADITDALTQGAVTMLKRSGYTEDSYEVFKVPGTVELTYAATQLARSGKYDAVIIFGCVIRGDTPHFDYVCDSVTQGMAYLNATQDVPVIFGVLTVEDHQQALDRAGGVLGNKGDECADAAISMIRFKRNLK